MPRILHNIASWNIITMHTLSIEQTDLTTIFKCSWLTVSHQLCCFSPYRLDLGQFGPDIGQFWLDLSLTHIIKRISWYSWCQHSQHKQEDIVGHLARSLPLVNANVRSLHCSYFYSTLKVSAYYNNDVALSTTELLRTLAVYHAVKIFVE